MGGHNKFRIFLRRLCFGIATCGKKVIRCRCLNEILDFFDCIMRFLGPCLILAALTLITGVAYVFFTRILPTMGLILRIANGGIGVFLYFNILYNYINAIRLEPGKPKEYEEIENVECEEIGCDEESEESSEDDEDFFRCNKAKVRQCGKCKLCKPARAHHCSICKRCVLRMDHHCPWINNCVGIMNYRYFCLFMLYLFIGCIFCIIHFYDSFMAVMYYRKMTTHNFQGKQEISFCFVLSGSIFIALSILGGFHAFLVLTNQTTIEFQQNWSEKIKSRQNGNIFRNPYDLGRSRNFQQIFGQKPFWSFVWMLPIRTTPQCDGNSFPTLYSTGKT